MAKSILWQGTRGIVHATIEYGEFVKDVPYLTVKFSGLDDPISFRKSIVLSKMIDPKDIVRMTDEELEEQLAGL